MITTIIAAKKTWVNVVGATYSAGGDPRHKICFNDFHDIARIKRLESSNAVRNSACVDQTVCLAFLSCVL